MIRQTGLLLLFILIFCVCRFLFFDTRTAMIAIKKWKEEPKNETFPTVHESGRSPSSESSRFPSSGRNDTGIGKDCSFVERITTSNLSVARYGRRKGIPIIPPIWVPAYPGSGSDMFRSLVTAVTGLGGDDFYISDSCTERATITCKTHWPSITYRREDGPPEEPNIFHNKVLFLIRNPRNALPSYFNWIWERDNNITDHSLQSPEREWQKWRDNNFTEGVRNWKNIITSWRQQKHYEVTLYMQYEKLTNPTTGPELFGRAVKELRQVAKKTKRMSVANGSSVVHVASDHDIPCLWYKVVKGKSGSSKTKRAGHSYKPAYTKEQKQQMLDMLDESIQEFNTTTTNSSPVTKNLVEILQSYRDDNAVNTPLEKE